MINTADGQEVREGRLTCFVHQSSVWTLDAGSHKEAAIKFAVRAAPSCLDRTPMHWIAPVTVFDNESTTVTVWKVMIDMDEPFYSIRATQIDQYESTKQN
jgi:hypothetical protein